MKDFRILIVDDEAKLRRILQIVLSDAGYTIDTAENGKKAWELFQIHDYSLVITDLIMPVMDGLELIKLIRQTAPDIPIIVITAYGSIESAVNAIKVGAYDYISKPFENEEIKLIVAKALDFSTLKNENTTLRKAIQVGYEYKNFIGNSSQIENIRNQVLEVAATSSTVLIQGESGTGKELIARMIHYNSQRAAAPFVAVNCGAFPESLLESELFGFEKGAFTGAHKKKPGKLEQANRGTFFLDEVGDMSPDLQVKMLRVLEEKSFESLGSTKSSKVDTRIIAATNKNLKQQVLEGHFRMDLYYRLNVYPIQTIPLREHRVDIPLLVERFVSILDEEIGKKIESVAPEAMDILQAHNWPGNVRELRNCLERAIIVCKEGKIRPSDLVIDQDMFTSQPSYLDLPFPADGISLEEVEKTLLVKALDMADGNQSKAAELLKISRNTLRYRLEKYQI